jgi:lysophospholipase L1-like esterase
VTKDLAGVANIYLMASSTSVGDPCLQNKIAEFGKMEKIRFRVVHFNNGMHGWGYNKTQYRAAFPQFLHAVHSLMQNDGALIWANTTPVRADTTTGATNPRIDERNEISARIVKAAGIPIDDQHSLMEQHRDLYQDDVHFNPAGAGIQGDHAASAIRSALLKGLPK